MPVQFHSRSALEDTPEKRLMFAVLMDAITQLQTGNAQDVVEAERWIRHDDGSVSISFVEACDALGLEPGGLADRLIGMRPHRRLALRPRHRVSRFGRLRAREGGKSSR